MYFIDLLSVMYYLRCKFYSVLNGRRIIELNKFKNLGNVLYSRKKILTVYLMLDV